MVKYKDINVSIDITTKKTLVQSLDAVIYSHDSNAVRVIAKITKNGESIDTDKVSLLLSSCNYNGYVKDSVSIKLDGTIVDDTATFELPNDILAYQGFLRLDFYIDWADGSNDGGQPVLFEIKKSTIDTQASTWAVTYISDFEQIKQQVSQAAQDALNTIDTDKAIAEFEADKQAVKQAKDEAIVEIKARPSELDEPISQANQAIDAKVESVKDDEANQTIANKVADVTTTGNDAKQTIADTVASVEESQQFSALTEALNRVNQYDTEIARKADKTIVDAQLAQKADLADLPSSAYFFKGSTTFSALPTSGNTLGDVYFTTDNNQNYAWEGTAWIAIGNGAFGNGTVTNDKLAKGAVSPDNTDFINVPVELASLSADKLTVQESGTSGLTYSFTNGVFNASIVSTYSYFWFLVEGLTVGKTYNLKSLFSGANGVFRVYNSLKSSAYTFNGIVNLVSGTDYLISPTESSLFIRYYVQTEYPEVSVKNISIVDTSESTLFLKEDIKVKAENLSSDFAIEGTMITNNSQPFFKTNYLLRKYNLFNKKDIIIGYQNVYGILVADPAFYYTKPIPVKPSTLYTVQKQRFVSLVSKDGIYSNANVADSKFTTLKNTEYVVMSGKIDTELDGVILIEGSYNGSDGRLYRPFEITFEGLKIDSGWKAKTIGTFGDSITEINKWQPYMRNSLDCLVLNYGAGGTKVAQIAGNVYDTTMSMCTDTRINAIATTVDGLLFMGGTNDFGQNIPLGTIDDTSPYTFYGALNILAQKLISRIPLKRIIFMTCVYSNNGTVNGSKNNLNLTIQDYNDCIKAIAKKYHYPCIDVGSYCGWNSVNYANFLSDGVHPSGSVGAKRMAEVIVGDLQRIQPFDYAFTTLD